jgi:hypothetical protein
MVRLLASDYTRAPEHIGHPKIQRCTLFDLILELFFSTNMILYANSLNGYTYIYDNFRFRMSRIYVQDLVIAYPYWILCTFGMAAVRHHENGMLPLSTREVWQ